MYIHTCSCIDVGANRAKESKKKEKEREINREQKLLSTERNNNNEP